MSASIKALAVEPESPIEYPESDGEPMAETDIHRNLMAELIAELETHFRDEPDVYVSGNLFIYYIEGKPGKRVAPDVFVVRGVPKHERRVYKLWEEGPVPEVAFEISSRKTWGDDLQRKWLLYARLGVKEYFLFDPEYDYLDEALVAYRLEDGQYTRIEVNEGRVHSRTLDLELVDTSKTLRLFNPQTGEFLPTRLEQEQARQQAEQARQQAEQARQQAEQARQQAEQARQQAE
ncbi:MAG: Uma2 family endonuclease, partial [Blastocatellia bacterium]